MKIGRYNVTDLIEDPELVFKTDSITVIDKSNSSHTFELEPHHRAVIQTQFNTIEGSIDFINESEQIFKCGNYTLCPKFNRMLVIGKR